MAYMGLLAVSARYGLRNAVALHIDDGVLWSVVKHEVRKTGSQLLVTVGTCFVIPDKKPG